MDTLQTQITTSTTEVKTTSTELSDLKRTYQSLQISRESAQAEVNAKTVSLYKLRLKDGFTFFQVCLKTTLTCAHEHKEVGIIDDVLKDL